jgi:hypothetical protein
MAPGDDALEDRSWSGVDRKQRSRREKEYTKIKRRIKQEILKKMYLSLHKGNKY